MFVIFVVNDFAQQVEERLRPNQVGNRFVATIVEHRLCNSEVFCQRQKLIVIQTRGQFLGIMGLFKKALEGLQIRRCDGAK